MKGVSYSVSIRSYDITSATGFFEGLDRKISSDCDESRRGAQSSKSACRDMKAVFKSSRPAREGELRPSFNRNQTVSALDWNYQSSAPTLRGLRRGKSFASFRAMSNSFFEAEARHEYWMEVGGFAVLTALAVWPIAQALHVMARTV